MKKLATLLQKLERNSLFKPGNTRLIAKGQNPLGEPSLVKVYPSLKPKRTRLAKLRRRRKLKSSQDQHREK